MASEQLRGEVLLAEAVLALAIRDVLHGTSERRKLALKDIASGRLDYWVDVVCCEGYSSDALRDALYGLLARCEDAA